MLLLIYNFVENPLMALLSIYINPSRDRLGLSLATVFRTLFDPQSSSK